MNGKAKAPEPGSGWEVGVDRYRDATKWVVAAFGSIGALIVAAVPVARLSDKKVENLEMLTTGVALAVGGSLIAILAALWNLAPQAVYPGDVNPANRNVIKQWLWRHARLEHKLHTDPNRFLPTGVASLADLDPAIAGLERLAANQAVRGVTDPAAKDASDASYQRLAGLRRVRRQIHGMARFEQARSRFRASLALLIVAAIATVSGLGLATYGLVETADDPAVELEDISPRSVSIILTTVGKETLAAKLGAACVANDIAALVLAGDATQGAWEVVTLETADCAVVRFILTGTLGTIS